MWTAFLANCFYLLLELLQIVTSPCRYLQFRHNLVDLLIIAYWFYLLAAISFQLHHSVWLTTCVFILQQLTLIQFMVCFDSTRYFVQMIQEVLTETIPFMCILAFVLLSYTQILLTLDITQGLTLHQAIESYIESYFFALGDFGGVSKKLELKIFVFLLFSFLISLTLMNLLIGIMTFVY